MSSSRRIGVVIVSYGHSTEIQRLVNSLQPQLKKDDRLVVVDNKKPYQLSQSLELKIGEIITHDNGGFGAGCNFGAATIIDDVDILLFLNPDTYLTQKDYLDTMRSGHGKYAAWQSLLLLPDGAINSAGNVYHITGLSWTGQYGSTDYPTKNFSPAVLSGACMAIDVSWWQKVQGFTEYYFMYGEDLDLSVKIVKAGGRLGVIPAAQINHEYDFEKGSWKWLYIERNRLSNMLINWPASLIILTFIPNLLFNMLIFVQYLAKGRPLSKIKADLSFLRTIPTCIKLRAQHQAFTTISRRTFMSHLSYELDSPLLGFVANNALINTVFMIYYKTIALFVR